MVFFAAFLLSEAIFTASFIWTQAPSESSTHRAVVAAADTPMALVTEGTCAVVMDKPAGPPAPLAFPSCGPPAMVSGRRGSCTTLLTDGTDAQIGPTQTGTTPTCLDVPNSLPTTTFRVPQPLPTDLPTPMPTTSNALTRPLHPTADDKPAASDPVLLLPLCLPVPGCVVCCWDGFWVAVEKLSDCDAMGL